MVNSPPSESGFAVVVVGGELLAFQFEGNRFFPATAQVDALEAGQLPDRHRHAGGRMAQVDLHHIIAVARSGVFDIDTDPESVDAQVGILEGGDN